MIKHQLEIRVTDAEGQPLAGVVVSATPEALGEGARAEFEEVRQLYFFDGLRPGFFNIRLEHSDYLTQEKRLQVHPKPTQVSFVLERPGTSHTFRGETRVPYSSEPELLGVIPSAETSAEHDDDMGPTLEGLFASLGLVPEQPAQGDDETGTLVLSSSAPLTAPPIIVRRTQSSEMVENDASTEGNDLKALRESPLVEAAGPIFRRSGEGFAVFTNRMMVRFLPEVTRQEAERLLAEEQLSIIEDIHFCPNLFLCEADASIGEEINLIAERLMNTGRVIYAEPNLAESPEADAVIPKDYLWDGTWDRQLVKAHNAWQRLHDGLGESAQFGHHKVIIAVIDSGLKSTGGVPDNEDFQGTVSDGSSKVYQLFSFAHMLPNNDTPVGNSPDHGVACAGVATGLANNFSTDPEVGIGVAGAAPNARVIGLIYPASERLLLEMFIWAAGLNARSNRAGFPANISPGADVFTCSMGFGSGAPLSSAAQDMFDYLTSRGRKGKGCVAIFSAGNANRNIENYRPYGAYERTFSCAASTLDSSGNEIRAPYSGWGRVAWCTPSNSHVPMRPHNPPHSYATWTASFLGEGNLPSLPDVTTILTQPASAGATTITVNSVNGLRRDTFILIGEPGKPGSEPVRITATPDPATKRVRITPLLNNHASLEEVAAGNNHHRNDFGGTSSATPLSAGICALVLSAQPNLTWVEVREILRSTAVKFDTQNTDPTGQWLDENGDPSLSSGLAPVFSQWYGYGRLDADAAVAAALAYAFPRDLMIRKSLADTGEQATAPSTDSPDIWVRNTDPATDTDALPSGFDQAGPHEDPRSSGGRWIYARIRNRGTERSFDAWARFYVASFNDAPLRHPEHWEPMNGLGNIAPDTWEEGTYLIGEVALPGIGPGEDLIVNIPWPDELVPPPLTPGGRPWNPHILVEVTPHDGPLDGELIHENNNLAAKAVTVADALTPLVEDTINDPTHA